MPAEALTPAPPPVAADPRDLAAIYEAHFDAVWQHLRRMGLAAADRDDLAQEVFLVAHRRLASLDSGRPVRPWLIGIATRVVLHHWRSARRRPGDHGAPGDEVLAHQAGDDADHAARELLARLLESLAPEHRAMFVLYELEGFSVPEIAEVTEIPANTVYSRLRRTRDELAARARSWQMEEAR